jgi:hypothetical protein
VPQVAAEECATCHMLMPKTMMRQVQVKRKAGYSSTTTTIEERREDFNYYRPVGKSHKQTSHVRVDRLWVCRGCKAPKSDGWFQRRLVILGVIVFVIYSLATGVSSDASYLADDGGGQAYLNEGVKTDDPLQGPSEKSTPTDESAIDTSGSDDETTVGLAGASPKEPPVAPTFEPSKEIVQPHKASPESYPPCSETVTDQCVAQ